VKGGTAAAAEPELWLGQINSVPVACPDLMHSAVSSRCVRTNGCPKTPSPVLLSDHSPGTNKHEIDFKSDLNE
jgi:hypothetical protein